MKKVLPWIAVVVILCVSGGVLVYSIPGAREAVMGVGDSGTGTSAVSSSSSDGSAPATPFGVHPDDIDLTEPSVVTLPRVDYYLYQEIETKLSSIQPDLMGMVGPMVQKIEAGEIQPMGPAIFEYDGISDDQDAVFIARMGFPVAGDATIPDGYQMKTLHEYKCFSTEFTGPVMGVSQAYNTLYTDLLMAGHQPTNVNREYYVHWEGPQSIDNQINICVGIE